jgi:hypothetical protein
MNISYLSGSATDHYPENIDHIIVNPRMCTRIEGVTGHDAHYASIKQTELNINLITKTKILK